MTFNSLSARHAIALKSEPGLLEVVNVTETFELAPPETSVLFCFVSRKNRVKFCLLSSIFRFSMRPE